MTIENLIRLINGRIINKPSVSSVSDFVFEPKNIKRGYAFIATNADENDIKDAIKHGAYAIISEDELIPSDSEIAYIKVDSLQNALMRLMRFEATHKNLKFCSINAVQKAIIERMSLSKNAILMPSEIKELFYKIVKAKNGDIFFSNEVRVLQRITPLYDAVWTDTKAQAINPSSIFFTTIICDDVYYQNLNIPRVFMGMFCGLLHYFKQNNITFKLNDHRVFGHFEPIFIDKNFKPISFGSSFRALIIEKDEELFSIEAAYLYKNFSEDEVVLCLPRDSEIDAPQAFRYDDLSEIKSLKGFRYALILCDKNEILSMLNQSKDQKKLFEF
ncbi:ferrochelatase [Campylobacter sp. faydin G-105]|uniref:ferrochelatase n=1 Tax=Campylobacter anatolicus TaxID=2829105 RepID=UPI001B9D4ECF|nr:ferrochelatase [Campylobacter anatolicus]MBR8462560.1 ferrochelatase [Campylobacter anatolicus]